MSEVEELRDQLAAAQAQLAEARERANASYRENERVRTVLYGTDWSGTRPESMRDELRRALSDDGIAVAQYATDREAAELRARLEAVRAALDKDDADERYYGCSSTPPGFIRKSVVRAALSAAPQPEPEASDPEWTEAKAGLERSLAETFAEHARAHDRVPPASDEPARCRAQGEGGTHGQTYECSWPKGHAESIHSWQVCGHTAAEGCTGHGDF